MRAATLEIARREFIEAAEATGAGPLRIMAVELPTAVPYLAAIAAIVETGRDDMTQIVLVLIYNVVFIAPLILPGRINSLSQTLIKLTSPGVPDTFQGNELWDFSLVDPDNRRPVDYERRRKAFESIRKFGAEPDESAISSLLATPEDGRLKLYLIWKTLCLRKQYPDIFQQGEYFPLTVEGANADHVVAFLRMFESASVLVVVPRMVATLLGDSNLPPVGADLWRNTHIVLPSRSNYGKLQNIFTGEVADLPTANQANIGVGEALAHFPAALCLLD